MKFSIIIPTYNRAAFLPKAMDSVLAQTFADWELIIVDDGSTDNTNDVVGKYTDTRIRYIYQANAERSAARNKGIQHATGEYVCFMDSDTYMKPERLALLSEVLDEKDTIACYYTPIEYRNDVKGTSIVKEGRDYSFPIDVNVLIQDIIATPQICCAIEILRRHQFNPALSIGEDMELLFRITEEYPLIYVPNQASVVEIEHEGRSVSFANKSRSSEKELKTLHIMFAKPHPASAISRKKKRERLAISYFNASKNYLLEGKLKGLVYLVQSILYDMQSEQLKYKCNIALSYITGKKNKLHLLLSE